MDEGVRFEGKPLQFKPGKEEVEDCLAADNPALLPISLIITDTTARSVEQALRRMNFPVSVERRTLWTLESPNFPEGWEKEVAETGELFNGNKEFVNRSPAGDPSTTVILKVTPRDDLKGRRILETLHHRFHLNYPQRLGHAVLWILRFDSTQSRQTLLPHIVSTHIFHNPVADHLCELTAMPT